MSTNQVRKYFLNEQTEKNKEGITLKSLQAAPDNNECDTQV